MPARRRPPRELRRECGAELGTGPRTLREELACDGQDRGEIDIAEGWPVLGMTRELRVEHGLDQRAERQAVGGGDEVDGRAHQRQAHDAPVLEELRQ